jgi:hypothetical protein
MKINGYMENGSSANYLSSLFHLPQIPKRREEEKRGGKGREEERGRSIVRLKYIKISSTVISRLGASLTNEMCVGTVATELKFVVSVACSSRNIIIRGNIQPHYYKHCSKNHNTSKQAFNEVLLAVIVKIKSSET